MSKVSYSWQDFDKDIDKLVHQIKKSQWAPDYIVGVKRGGLIPAIKLSHYFNKPMIMMSCQFRDNKDHQVKLLEAENLEKDSKILIVDDICDSGITMSQIIIEFISRGHFGVKTCALYYNTIQNFFVDYPARSMDRTKNKDWIVFPWEM